MPASKNSPTRLPDDAYDLTPADIERAFTEQSLGMAAPNNPVLAQKAAPVAVDAIDSEHVKRIIARLYRTADDQRASRKGKKKRTLVGLAAPQLGEALRIVLIDTKVQPSRKQYHRPECFINPQIVWRSHETAEGREGCFSTGPVWGLVRRSVAVKIRAYTPEGKMVERIFEGFTACIAQHEIDHLEGVRFPDRIISDKKRHWVHAEEIDDYPKHIKHWPRLCSVARWKHLSNTA
jgi:peptide deformylase